MRKLTFEYVKNYFEEAGCTLISTEYINCDALLKYICSCGTEAEISWSNFRGGKRCVVCAIVRNKEKQKLSYEYVKKYFESKGCVLIDKEYINARTKLRYICSCGNEATMAFHVFKKGHLCKKCGTVKGQCSIRKTMEESNRWLPQKDLPLLHEYRKVVYNFSNRNYRKYKNIVNPDNLPRGFGKYHLDHKYSVSEGFKNNIPPFIMGDISNLEIISEVENIRKGGACSITLDDLYKQVE